MNTVESKLIYLLHIWSHRNYATVNVEPELGWTDSMSDCVVGVALTPILK